MQAPFPCLSTERDDDGSTDVEMDPASQIKIQQIIESHSMQVVGWYHSHPKFQPDPSVTDIQNQRNYQCLFTDAKTGIAPFVGLIVGTYDTSMRSPTSIFRYFHVRTNRGNGLDHSNSSRGADSSSSSSSSSSSNASGKNGNASSEGRSTSSFASSSSRGGSTGGSSSSFGGIKGWAAYPMRLKATVRSFRHGLSDAERQETREAALEQLRRRHLWQQQQQRRLEGGITSSEESDENDDEDEHGNGQEKQVEVPATNDRESSTMDGPVPKVVAGGTKRLREEGLVADIVPLKTAMPPAPPNLAALQRSAASMEPNGSLPQGLNAVPRAMLPKALQ